MLLEPAPRAPAAQEAAGQPPVGRGRGTGARDHRRRRDIRPDTGHSPGSGQLAANQQQNTAVAPALGTYPGQQQRGVSQTVDRVVASGKTIVTMGSQSSDGVVRQQFFASTDGGATWRLASVHAPGGGSAPLGHAAARLAGGPAAGWRSGRRPSGPAADGLSWTLAATHGVPQLPGDQLLVINSTAHGFLAAGVAAASGGGPRPSSGPRRTA